jgi:GNAT superfamily N-acetyltransferase
MNNEYNIIINEINDWGRGKESIVIQAIKQDDGVVGEAVFAYDKNLGEIRPGNVQVNPDHRRKGLATKMYKMAESYSGLKLIPSKDQSFDAKSFWEYYHKL